MQATGCLMLGLRKLRNTSIGTGNIKSLLLAQISSTEGPVVPPRFGGEAYHYSFGHTLSLLLNIDNSIKMTDLIFKD